MHDVENCFPIFKKITKNDLSYKQDNNQNLETKRILVLKKVELVY